MTGKTRKAPLYADLSKKKTQKTKVAKAPTPQVIKDEVKKALAKELENKFTCRYTPGNGPTASFTISPGGPSAIMSSMFINQSVSTNGDFYRVLPSIAEGTSTTERVGTIITPKYMRSHLQFALNGAFTSSQHLRVRCMAFTLKGVKSYDEFDTSTINYANKLFWDGQAGASTNNPGGQPFYLTLPLNKREVNILKDETFILDKGTGTSRQGGPTVDGTQTFQSAYGPFHECDVEWKTPATFKYNENVVTGSGYPSNYAPYIAVIVTQMDGRMTATEGDNKNLVVMNIRTTLSYEDA